VDNIKKEDCVQNGGFSRLNTDNDWTETCLLLNWKHSDVTYDRKWQSMSAEMSTWFLF